MQFPEESNQSSLNLKCRNKRILLNHESTKTQKENKINFVLSKFRVFVVEFFTKSKIAASSHQQFGFRLPDAFLLFVFSLAGGFQFSGQFLETGRF